MILGCVDDSIMTSVTDIYTVFSDASYDTSADLCHSCGYF